jgi:hypothetical protein
LPITKISLASSVWAHGRTRRSTAIVARDQHAIHFRCAEPATANPEKYSDELLDAYVLIEDADALYAEYAARGVEFTRELGNTPWHSREFVVKDCDGRLLAFGELVACLVYPPRMKRLCVLLRQFRRKVVEHT